MLCPACGETLSKLVQADLTVDVCKTRCGGIWFDNYELEKVDEAHESLGQPLLDLSPHTAISSDQAAKRRCPKCPDSGMRRNFFSVQQQVEVDGCPTCGGIWLDASELASIRERYTTEVARKEAADKYFSKLFDTELKQVSGTSTEEARRAQKVARAFRFVLPSYWLPGTQGGGPF